MKTIINDMQQYRFLLWELVKKGIKLKYRRSYLGIIWTLIEPLLTMCVLTIVFGTLMGNHERSFPVYILTGRLLYSMFSTGTSAAMKSIRANSAMIKKVYVPKYMYPLSAILFNYIIFLLSLVVLAIVSVILGVMPTPYLLLSVIPLFNILLVSLGVGLILGTFSVFFRDLEYLWNVALMLIMYTSAIFYKPEVILKSKYALIIQLNPVFGIINNFRSCVFGTPMNYHYTLYCTGMGLFLVVFGFWIFNKNQNRFVLHL